MYNANNTFAQNNKYQGTPISPNPNVHSLPLFYGQTVGGQSVNSQTTTFPLTPYNYGMQAPQGASIYQVQYTRPIVPQNSFPPPQQHMPLQQPFAVPNGNLPSQFQYVQQPLQNTAFGAAPSATTHENWANFNAETTPKYPELVKFDDPFELKEVPVTPKAANNNVEKPSLEAVQSSTHPKRCKRCSKYYQDSEPSECRFHPGQYKCWYSSKVLAGHINSWTCCKVDEREAKGCKVLTSHIECEQTSAMLSQWDTMISVPQPTPTVPSKPTPKNSSKSDTYPRFDEEKEEFIDPTLDLSINMKSFRIQPEPIHSSEEKNNVLDPDAQLVMEDGQQFIKHIVKYTDTLRGLSLRYQVSPEEIKLNNKIVRDEDIWSRHTLLIPYNGQHLKELDEEEKEKYRNEMRKRMVRRFMKVAKCGNESEALYYLQMSSFKLEDAVAEYRADVEWDVKNRHVTFTSVKA